MNTAQHVTNMTIRSRRRLVFFLILTAAAFLSLQLSGISLQDFDNAGQMQENSALPTSRNRPNGGSAQDDELSRNTLRNSPRKPARQQEDLIKKTYSENDIASANKQVILEKENTHTNHDRHTVDFSAKDNNKLLIRNLASSKLQDSVDHDRGQTSKEFAIISPPAHSVTNSTNRNRNKTTTAHSLTERSNQSKYEEEVRRLGDSYEVVPPSVLQEENCPVCFGTSLCDQLYAGNIKWNQKSAVEVNKNVKSYNGTWIGESQDRVSKVTIKQFSNHRMLDNYICQMTSAISTENLSYDQKIRRQCDVSARVLATGLAKNKATQQEYVRKEIGKLQYRQNTLFSLPKCASQRLLDRLRTGDHSSDRAMLSTALILNPQTLLLKFINEQVPELGHYFPSYYGECGHTIVQEHESYRPLKTFLPKSWLVRVDLALQVLQMVEDFHTASPEWMVLFGNITYDNLAVTEEGKIKVVNLQDVMIVDRSEINQTLQSAPTTTTTEPCNEDCLFNYAIALSKAPDVECGNADFYSQVMYMLACQRFLSDQESTKVIRFFDFKGMDYASHPGGLLRDPPYELELRLTELLYECVFESRPGSRLVVSATLKKMLYVIKRSKIGSAYW